MDVGIAECLLLARHELVLADSPPAEGEAALGRLARRIQGHADAGLIAQDAPRRVAAISAADGVANAVLSADPVIEAVPEDLRVKESVLCACAGPPRRTAPPAIDSAGLDVYNVIAEQQYARFGERFRVPEPLRALVRAGRIGINTGAGTYDYPHGATDDLLDRDRKYAALNQLLAWMPPLESEGGTTFGD